MVIEKETLQNTSNKNILTKTGPSTKCGEVYLSNKGDLLFHCHLCNKHFENFKFFFHLSDEHIVKHNEALTTSTVSSIISTKKESIKVPQINKNTPNSTTSKNITKIIESSNIDVSEKEKTPEKDKKQTNIPITVLTSEERQKVDQNKIIDNEIEKDIKSSHMTEFKIIIDFIKGKPLFIKKPLGSTIEERLSAVKPLSEKLKKTPKRIIQQICYIRNKYLSEKKRIKQNFQGNRPPWIWYNECKFLDNSDSKTKTNEREKDEQTEEERDKEEEEEEIGDEQSKSKKRKVESKPENDEFNFNIDDYLAFQVPDTSSSNEY